MSNNIKFIAYVNLLDSLAKVNILQRDPDNSNNLLIFRENTKTDTGEIVDGWFTQNIFDVAQELFNDPTSYGSLLKCIREKGYEPVYQNGEFVALEKTA